MLSQLFIFCVLNWTDPSNVKHGYKRLTPARGQAACCTYVLDFYLHFNLPDFVKDRFCIIVLVDTYQYDLKNQMDMAFHYILWFECIVLPRYRFTVMCVGFKVQRKVVLVKGYFTCVNS